MKKERIKKNIASSKTLFELSMLLLLLICGIGLVPKPNKLVSSSSYLYFIYINAVGYQTII